MFSYFRSFIQSQEQPVEKLPSLRYQPISDNLVLANLKPQRILRIYQDGTYVYDDSYSGVIVTKWSNNKFINANCTPYYYSLHIDREEWEKIVDILNENKTPFDIISDLPDGAKNGNFLEDLAKRWFELDINY